MLKLIHVVAFQKHLVNLKIPVCNALRLRYWSQCPSIRLLSRIAMMPTLHGDAYLAEKGGEKRTLRGEHDDEKSWNLHRLKKLQILQFLQPLEKLKMTRTCSVN